MEAKKCHEVQKIQIFLVELYPETKHKKRKWNLVIHGRAEYISSDWVFSVVKCRLQSPMENEGQKSDYE